MSWSHRIWPFKIYKTAASVQFPGKITSWMPSFEVLSTLSRFYIYNLLTPHQYISLRVSSPHTHTQEAPYWLEITLQQCSSTALSALSDLLCSVWIFRELTDFPLDFAGFFPQATWKPRKNPVQPGKFPVILAIWHNHRQWSKRFILFLWFMQVSQAVVT